MNSASFLLHRSIGKLENPKNPPNTKLHKATYPLNSTKGEVTPHPAFSNPRVPPFPISHPNNSSLLSATFHYPLRKICLSQKRILPRFRYRPSPPVRPRGLVTGAGKTIRLRPRKRSASPYQETSPGVYRNRCMLETRVTVSRARGRVGSLVLHYVITYLPRY